MIKTIVYSWDCGFSEIAFGLYLECCSILFTTRQILNILNLFEFMESIVLPGWSIVTAHFRKQKKST